MKRQSLTLLLFSLLTCICNLLLPAAGIGVKDMFSGYTQDELVAQVQEGENLLRYMENEASPEERAAFEQAMMDMFDQLSPEDLAEIEAIAQTVEPHIQMNEPVKENKKDKVVEKKKDASKVVSDDSIKALLITINKTIDTIMIKIESDPFITDHFEAYTIKQSIALLQRCISLLNTKQNLKRLSDKKNKKNEKLIKGLKEFKKKIAEKNKSFHIDDSFGTSSKKSNKDSIKKHNKVLEENMRKLDEIIQEFINGFDTVLPEMEKFIRQYEEEAQELAQMYAKLKEESQKFAKAAQSGKPGKRNQRQQQQQKGSARSQSGQKPGGGNKGYYDPYYDDYYNPYGQQENKKKKNTPENKRGNRQLPREKNDKEKEKELTAYEFIVDKLEEYVDAYGDEDVELVKSAYTKLPHKHYARYNNRNFDIQSCTRHIEQFGSNELKDIDASFKMMEEPLQNFSDLVESLQEAEKRIRELSLKEVKELQENAAYTKILDRAKMFSGIIDSYLPKEQARYKKNLRELQDDANEIRNNLGGNPSPANVSASKKADMAIQALEDLYKQNYTNYHAAYHSKIRTAGDIFERAVKSIKRKRERELKRGKNENTKRKPIKP